MNIIKNKLCLGATKPFAFMHMSDTHFCYADEWDNERKRDLAQSRDPVFPDAERYAREAEEFAKANGILICHTGDLIDFVSEANLARTKQFTDANDVFLAAGNHEFSQYVGEAWEDEAYRNQTLDKVQACFKNNIRFDSRKINGVNLIAIDNGYYQFDEGQFASLKMEAEYGLPMVLFMHTPLYCPELYESIRANGMLGDCAYIAGVPEELMKGFSAYRYRQQKPDEVTLETLEFINNEPLIKAVFAGHLHKLNIETRLTDTKMQYISGFEDVRLVEIE